ncbi:DUF1659 domain-containing protein [Oceanobacillus damuensis]|uniref:DUF1659 domain-containing protein n=1 Tax=Oceanobacillus damuensis TaxID=937928 RepID=UPI000836724A|nr:DUF1659 domain-containing protein [Oceanobacillus damuensis]
MAIADMTNSTLQLVFTDGIDSESGLPIFKYKSFNNVKTSATTDQLYAVATAIADLQERPLYNINRKDTSDIREG